MGKKLKTQIIGLCSKGIPYANTPLGGSLIDGHSLEVQPFTAGSQKSVTLQTRDTYTFYRQLFSELVVTPKLETFDELLMGDIVPILVAIKSFTYGPKYTKEAKCVGCNTVVTFDFKLTDFPLVTVDSIESSDELEDGEVRVFKTTGLTGMIEDHLSGDKFDFTFHLATLSDEKRLGERMITLVKQKIIDSDNVIDRSWVRTLLLIDTINGASMTIQDKLKWLDDKDVTFPERLIEQIADKELGIIDGCPVGCPKCGTSNIVDLTVDHSFFRPPVSPHKTAR